MNKLIASAALFTASLVASPRAEAACGVTGHVVTYYSEPDQSVFSTDPRCTIVRNVLGTYVCRIELRGVLYSPIVAWPVGQPPPQLPAIIWNHGSEHTFDAETKACKIAEYFVPQGYHVFAPFRRGQGEVPSACIDANDNRLSTLTAGCARQPNESTGTYIKQALNSYTPTSTCSRSCKNVELLQAQVADVNEAYDWLLTQSNVADDKIAIAGSSYGGIMTVFFNSVDRGQACTMAFSPGADSWEGASGPNTTLQTALKTAAHNAKSPTYYMQPKWDHDTRPTVELSREHIMGGTDPAHGKIASATIFDVPKPAIDPTTGLPDYQSVHASFPSQTDKWGLAAVDFLSRMGVE